MRLRTVVLNTLGASYQELKAYTRDKQPVQFFILPGSYVDVTALQMMHLDLPVGSEVFGDAGYTDYEQEELYAACEQINLRIQRKSTSQRPDQAWEATYKKGLRQRIEQVFSHITIAFRRRFMRLPKRVFSSKLFCFY
jgi:hypothetical protein